MMRAFDTKKIAWITKPIDPCGVELGCGCDINIALKQSLAWDIPGAQVQLIMAHRYRRAVPIAGLMGDLVFPDSISSVVHSAALIS